MKPVSGVHMREPHDSMMNIQTLVPLRSLIKILLNFLIFTGSEACR